MTSIKCNRKICCTNRSKACYYHHQPLNTKTVAQIRVANKIKISCQRSPHTSKVSTTLRHTFMTCSIVWTRVYASFKKLKLGHPSQPTLTWSGSIKPSTRCSKSIDLPRIKFSQVTYSESTTDSPNTKSLSVSLTFFTISSKKSLNWVRKLACSRLVFTK